MTRLKTADEWFTEGMRQLDLSRSADTSSDYQGDLEAACAAFEQCLTLNTGHLEALRQRGLTLLSLERHTEALDCLVAAAAQRPDDRELLFAAAKCTSALGEFANAVPLWERVRALSPGEADIAFELARALTRSGQSERSLPLWDECLRAFSAHGLSAYRRREAALERAIALAQLERDGAVEAFRAAFEAYGSELGQAPMVLDRFAPARRALRLAEADHALDPARLRTFARVWERAGDSETAAELRQAARRARVAAVEQSPDDPARWLARAEDHLADGEHEQAFVAFERSVALSPDPARSQAALRLSYERGRFEKSGPWKLMGHDTFAREDFVVGTFATRAEAAAALAERERRTASTADESLRDSYWLVRA